MCYNCVIEKLLTFYRILYKLSRNFSDFFRLLYLLTFLLFMIPLSEQYRINIKNAIELIDKTLESVEKSNVILSGKHLRDIRKEISKKPYQKLP